LTERLGRDVAGPDERDHQAVDDEVGHPDPLGPIPADEGEVNGQTLQVLSRLYWANRDSRYQTGGRSNRPCLSRSRTTRKRLGADALVDFTASASTTSVAQLRDHGNEVVAGLVEYHLIETALGLPEAADHRLRIRAMLDRLLIVGRDADGMWRSTIESRPAPHSRTRFFRQLGLRVRRLSHPGDDRRNGREATSPSPSGIVPLRARDSSERRPGSVPLAGLRTGWATPTRSRAHSICSIASTCQRRRAGPTGNWDLFGAQDDDGRVEDRYLDGNFVRTALLYAAWQSQGTRLERGAPRRRSAQSVTALAWRS